MVSGSPVPRKIHDDGKRATDRAIIGITVGLAVAMGIGRFAYTPILPMMQDSFHFSATMAGLLASANYAGYLAGAILAGMFPTRSRGRLAYVGLIGSSLSTGLMGLTHSYVMWSVLRGLSGMASAFLLVLSSSLMMDWLSIRDKESRISYIDSGPGVGMTVTGILVPLRAGTGRWPLAWEGLGIASMVLTVCSRMLTHPVRLREQSQQGVLARTSFPGTKPETEPGKSIENAHLRPPFPLWGITAAYGSEGLSYAHS